MPTTKSLFGVYAEELQAVVDSAKDFYDPTWFNNYFTWDAPQLSLTFQEAIGRSRIEPIASLVATDSKAPIRSRPALEKLQGSIPTISEKFYMDSEKFRTMYMMQQMRNIDGGVKKQMILDLLFDDVTKIQNSTNKRIDFMCLEGISTGTYTATTTNNPDGIVFPVAIDLMMPAANKVNATVEWGTVATSKPITVDFKNIIALGRARGIRFKEILMTWNSFYEFIASTEVKDLYTYWIGKAGSKLIPNRSNVNDLLGGQDMPPITIVDTVFGVEKDGVVVEVAAFKDDAVVFIPEGSLGKIKTAFSMDDMQRQPQVAYAKSGQTLITKWGETDPLREWTKGELIGIPAITAIDAIYILTR